jgi:hypothetical protein
MCVHASSYRFCVGQEKLVHTIIVQDCSRADTDAFTGSRPHCRRCSLTNGAEPFIVSSLAVHVLTLGQEICMRS